VKVDRAGKGGGVLAEKGKPVTDSYQPSVNSLPVV
jgi:hypothetical protein